MRESRKFTSAVFAETVANLKQEFSTSFGELLNRLLYIDDNYGTRDRRILSILNFFRTNFRDVIVPSEIAWNVGLTTYSLSRLFRAQTSRTFTDLLTEVRVKSAARMIWETDEPIENIAYDCGFGTGRSFTREFRKYTGFTPSDFRVHCLRLLRFYSENNHAEAFSAGTYGYNKADNEVYHYRYIVAECPACSGNLRQLNRRITR